MTGPLSFNLLRYRLEGLGSTAASATLPEAEIGTASGGQRGRVRIATMRVNREVLD